MKQKIITAIKKFLWWMKFLLWTKPTAKPPKEAPIRVKGEQVFDDYIVIDYHGHMISLRKWELPIWRMSSRKDKRAMAERFRVLEAKGFLRFEKINGKFICLKNKDYGAKENVR